MLHRVSWSEPQPVHAAASAEDGADRAAECRPGCGGVAEIAGRCGFTELGRFAGAYRTAFGESPSTTLRGTRGPRTLDHIFADSAYSTGKPGA
jgi:AraC-like DNA-binding protein